MFWHTHQVLLMWWGKVASLGVIRLIHSIFIWTSVCSCYSWASFMLISFEVCISLCAINKCCPWSMYNCHLAYMCVYGCMYVKITDIDLFVLWFDRWCEYYYWDLGLFLFPYFDVFIISLFPLCTYSFSWLSSFLVIYFLLLNKSTRKVSKLQLADLIHMAEGFNLHSVEYAISVSKSDYTTTRAVSRRRG